jgi:hypothetical protein
VLHVARFFLWITFCYYNNFSYNIYGDDEMFTKMLKMIVSTITGVVGDEKDWKPPFQIFLLFSSNRGPPRHKGIT